MAWASGVLLLLAVVVLAVVVVRRRRTSRALSREDQLRLGRRAAQQITRANRRTRRGSLRGEGGGGSDRLAQDAAYGSGEGGMP